MALVKEKILLHRVNLCGIDSLYQGFSLIYVGLTTGIEQYGSESDRSVRKERRMELNTAIDGSTAAEIRCSGSYEYQFACILLLIFLVVS